MKTLAILPSGFQQHQGAGYVGFQKRPRPGNTAVHVALGRKVNGRVTAENQIINQGGVQNGALGKPVPGVRLHLLEPG